MSFNYLLFVFIRNFNIFERNRFFKNIYLTWNKFIVSMLRIKVLIGLSFVLFKKNSNDA